MHLMYAQYITVESSGSFPERASRVNYFSGLHYRLRNDEGDKGETNLPINYHMRMHTRAPACLNFGGNFTSH